MDSFFNTSEKDNLSEAIQLLLLPIVMIGIGLITYPIMYVLAAFPLFFLLFVIIEQIMSAYKRHAENKVR